MVLASLDDNVFNGGIFSALDITEAVQLGAVCKELRIMVHSLRVLKVPQSGTARLTMTALLAFDLLEELSLDDGFQLDDTAAKQLLAGLPKLQRLTVVRASVSSLEIFQTQEPTLAPQLQHLSLPRSPSLYKDVSPALFTWPSLQSLDLTKSLLTDPQFEALLLALPSLKTFIVRECRNLQLCGLSLDLDTAVPSLEVIDLSGTRVVDRTAQHLATLPSLRTLLLEKCTRLQAPKIVNAHLQRLCLARCDSLLRPSVATPKLKELILRATSVGDDVVEQILVCCWGSLRHLDLSECTANLGHCHTPQGLCLERLIVSRSCVSFSFIEALVASSGALSRLEAAAVHAVFQLRPPCACGLRRIVLDQAELSDEALQKLVAQCPELEALSLRYCTGLHAPPHTPYSESYY